MVRRKPEARSLTARSGVNRSTSADKTKTGGSGEAENPVKRRKRNTILREIKHLRRTSHLLIPKTSFAKLVREIILELAKEACRIQSFALEALHEAAEMYIVQFFEDSVLLAMHARRVTVMVHDMLLLRRIRGRNDVINR